MNILFKFATRARPYLFLRSLKNIKDTIHTDNYEVLVTADLDDVHMNSEYVKKEVDEYKNITWAWGMSSSKINAINRDMDKATSKWDILINMSDDMQFQYPGWDVDMIKAIKDNWTDTDFFAHFNDGFTGEAIPSMSIMGRKYYERFNYIYHSDYISLWSDNEAMEVAQLLGKHKYFPEVLYKHLHPATVNIPQDSLYKFNEQWYAIDQITFEERKLKNFDLPCTS